MDSHRFAVATAVKCVDSNNYTGFLQDSWCIGTGRCISSAFTWFSNLQLMNQPVPHGGYVASCILMAARLHFGTTLEHLHQPHAITQHLTYVRRTTIGPFKICIKETKLGQRTSTIHVTLVQGANRECVLGYITQSNIASESGITLPTTWSLFPPPAPADVVLLASDGNPGWQLRTLDTHAKFRKATSRVQCAFPRYGQAELSIVDQWMRFKNGEKFTNESLGFVVDMFPQIVEMYREDGQGKKIAQGYDPEAMNAVDSRKWGPMWYPTILLNLDVKKLLPEEGVEWLFLRVHAKQIRDGRLDLEVIVMDEDADLVAISNHVSLIVSAERNTAQRKEEITATSKI